MFGALPVAHHLLLGHGLARAGAAGGQRDGEVGTATNHITGVADHGQRGRPGGRRPRRHPVEPPVRRPGAARHATPTRSRDLMPGPVADDLALDLGSRSTSTASTTTTRCGVAGRSGGRGAALRVRRHRRATRRPTSAGRWSPVGMHRPAGGTWRERYPGIPPIVITENGASYGDGARRRRRGRRPAAHRLPRRPPARRGRGDRRGRRRARLLLLVADGQLRVGARLHPALRAGPRRLRHPGAHPEALLRLVRRRHHGPPPPARLHPASA